MISIFKILAVIMVADYLLAIMVAVAKGSTAKGSLKSKIMAKGILKKCAELCLIIAIYISEHYLNMDGTARVIAIGFLISEILSLFETADYCGVKVPWLKDQLEQMKEGEQHADKLPQNSKKD